MLTMNDFDYDVSEGEAIRELRKHEVKAFAATRVFSNGVEQRWLFTEATRPEPIACADEFGEYHANDIMFWLGY